MILTKKKKQKYYQIYGGSSNKAKTVKKISSPESRMRKHRIKNTLGRIGAYAIITPNYVSSFRRRTTLLPSRLIKRHFVRNNIALKDKHKKKIAKFADLLEKYKTNKNIRTPTGQKFSRKIKRIINYMKAKETTAEKLKRYQNEYNSKTRTSESNYIDRIQAKLNAMKLTTSATTPTSTSTSATTPTRLSV